MHCLITPFPFLSFFFFSVVGGADALSHLVHQSRHGVREPVGRPSLLSHFLSSPQLYFPFLSCSHALSSLITLLRGTSSMAAFCRLRRYNMRLCFFFLSYTLSPVQQTSLLLALLQLFAYLLLSLSCVGSASHLSSSCLLESCRAVRCTSAEPVCTRIHTYTCSYMSTAA